MGRGARTGLLCTAAIVGGGLAVLGDTFSAMADPERHDAWTTVFWLAIGALLSVPMWGPAIVPRRHAALARIARWTGAALLALPIALFGSIFVHGVARWRDGAVPSAPALRLGAITVGACAVSLTLLPWPDVRACLSRRSPS